MDEFLFAPLLFIPRQIERVEQLLKNSMKGLSRWKTSVSFQCFLNAPLPQRITALLRPREKKDICILNSTSVKCVKDVEEDGTKERCLGTFPFPTWLHSYKDEEVDTFSYQHIITYLCLLAKVLWLNSYDLLGRAGTGARGFVKEVKQAVEFWIEYNVLKGTKLQRDITAFNEKN